MAKEEIVEDFLEVDRPVPGQNYCCISFISPENILKQKEVFLSHKYTNHLVKQYSDKIDQLVSLNEDLDSKTITQLKEDLKSTMESTYQEYKEKLEDFKFITPKLYDEFEEQNNFRTSVRGVKMRGTYDTYREAQVRAKVLQRIDQSHNVFVGQVGYWLPWDPEADKIQDQEYVNEELNKLMKEYKTNETKRDLFYEEQKREAIQKGKKERIKKMEEEQKEESKSNELEDNQHESQTQLDETKKSIFNSDPWFDRKTQEKDNDVKEI